jgi:hypothetical protein
MTRMFRAIRFPRVLVLPVLLSAAFTSGAALADSQDASTLQNVEAAVSGLAPGDRAAPQTTLPTIDADMTPAIETPLHHFYCVEYARLRSGLEIFGDAKLWWARAKNVYQEFEEPAADSVMVFAGSRRIARGHVAVVTEIVSPREIRVDQANWQNHGEIDRNTPVLDVSAGNDWSKVRVWDMRSGQYGGHVYAIKGFIARNTPTSTSAGL